MKVEIIVAAVLATVSIGERQERSAVLTDETKRILEHFDFSNFDKQEALNYLDRQRYENQIRGKRSQSNIRRGHDENYEKNQDLKRSHHYFPGYREEGRPPLNPNLRYQRPEPNAPNAPAREIENSLKYRKKGTTTRNYNKKLNSTVRSRRGHRKKKHRNNFSMYKDEEENEDNYGPYRKLKKKRKPHWDRWSDWSSCSVTCGKGRKIRWRRCIAKICSTGEFEMGEKTCQLPACNLLTKLLGF